MQFSRDPCTLVDPRFQTMTLYCRVFTDCCSAFRRSNLLPTRPGEAKNSLDTAIDQASQATAEGRGALQGLRSFNVGGTDQKVPDFDVTVEGNTTKPSSHRTRR